MESKSISMGTAVLIVASRLLITARGAFSSIFSFSLLFFMESTEAMRFSTEPYSCRSFVAVFSPTPGMPGILSEESPISPFKSINCCGVRPYFSSIALRSYTSNSEIPLLVKITFVTSVTS